MTLFLVLHTGTMFAVIVHFWRQWRTAYFPSVRTFQIFAGHVVIATTFTAGVGAIIIKIIERSSVRAAAFRQ